MLWCRPGTSPNAGQARSKVKAGLKVSRGLTSEASARARAKVERRVATQLNRAEASSATTKRPSMRGRCVAHESAGLPCRGVSEHWVSKSVPAPGHQRWTTVPQQALVQNGQQRGQDSGNERQESSHDESFSLQQEDDHFSVYHSRKGCPNRSF